jgi:hypothetical protein
MTEAPRTLADDILPSVEAIAAYLGKTPRQVRHLIDRHDLPIRKVAGIESKKSWLDAFYATPDRGRGDRTP